MYNDNYSRRRATREAIARDGTSMLEFANRIGLSANMVEDGLAAFFLAEHTKFTEGEIIEMGRD